MLQIEMQIHKFSKIGYSFGNMCIPVFLHTPINLLKRLSKKFQHFFVISNVLPIFMLQNVGLSIFIYPIKRVINIYINAQKCDYKI